MTASADDDRPLTAKDALILARRRRVATLLGRCYTTGEIAELLGVSTDTVARDIKVVHAEFTAEMRATSGVMDVWHRFQRQHLARVRELWRLVDRAQGVYEEREGKRVQVVTPDPHIGLKALRELRACADDEIKTMQSLGIVYKAPERRSIDLHLMDQLSTVPEADIDRLLAAPLDELPRLLEAMVGTELSARVLGTPASALPLPDVPDADDVRVEDAAPAGQSGAIVSPDGLDGSPASAQTAAAEETVAPPPPDPRPGGAPPMSWSQFFPSLEDFQANRPQVASVFDAALAADGKAQVDAARAAAESLIASGAVGGAGKDYTVALSGHVNPGHEPSDGWANDCVTVSIYQKPAAAPAAPPASESADATGQP